MRKILMFTQSLLILCSIGYAQETTNILFVGNSYTYANNFPNRFESMANAQGYNVHVEQYTLGGYTLFQHYNNSTTTNLIKSKNWDHVILQEQSLTPVMSYNSFSQASRLLTEQVIRASNKCADVTYFMTWGRQDPPTQCSCGYADYDAMQADMTTAYENVAYETFGTLAPVGVAWQKVMNSGNAIQLYTADGSHPSLAGTYLMMYVFYATFFHESPVGITDRGSLTEGDALFLQQKAYETYLEYKQAGFFTPEPFYLEVIDATPSPLETGCSLPKKLHTQFDAYFSGKDTTSTFSLVNTITNTATNTEILRDTLHFLSSESCEDSTFTIDIALDLEEFGEFEVTHQLIDSQDRDIEDNGSTFNINNPGLNIDLSTPGAAYVESFEYLSGDTLAYWYKDDLGGVVEIAVDTNGLQLPEIPDGKKISYLWQIFESDNWLMSPCLILDEEASYELTFSYANSPIFTNDIKLQLYLGPEQDRDKMEMLLEDYSSFYAPQFMKSTEYFTPSSSGAYSLGWKTSWVDDASLLTIDSIAITNVGVITAWDDVLPKQNTLHVFPNPATHMIHVEGNGTLRFYNSLGQLIKTDSINGDQEYDVSGWPKGVYYLENQINNDFNSTKFIKK